MLKDSKKISAVFSRFSGALSGGSVYEGKHSDEVFSRAFTGREERTLANIFESPTNRK
jgi:hypothetical protein